MSGLLFLISFKYSPKYIVYNCKLLSESLRGNVDTVALILSSD